MLCSYSENNNISNHLYVTLTYLKVAYCAFVHNKFSLYINVQPSVTEYKRHTQKDHCHPSQGDKVNMWLSQLSVIGILSRYCWIVNNTVYNKIRT